MRVKHLLAVAVLASTTAMALGCSSGQTTSTTTTYSPAPPQSENSSPPSATTTTTTTEEPDSVLGAAFHLVGTIIMLPFRVIGLIV